MLWREVTKHQVTFASESHREGNVCVDIRVPALCWAADATLAGGGGDL